MPKTKVKVTVPAQLEKRVSDQLKSYVGNPELLNEVGVIARKDIVAQIIQAKEPATGQPFKNRNITSEWRDRKKKLSGSNPPLDGPAGSGKLARLVFTGQWIKSFIHLIKKVEGKNVIEIGPSGQHQPYVNAEGKNVGKVVDNEVIGKGQLAQGRNWLGVTERTQKTLVSIVRTYIRRQLTKRNK